MKNRNSILSKSSIEEHVWDFNTVADSSVKTLIKKLRGKIGHDAIMTHSNTGYSISLEKNI